MIPAIALSKLNPLPTETAQLCGFFYTYFTDKSQSSGYLLPYFRAYKVAITAVFNASADQLLCFLSNVDKTTLTQVCSYLRDDARIKKLPIPSPSDLIVDLYLIAYHLNIPHAISVATIPDAKKELAVSLINLFSIYYAPDNKETLVALIKNRQEQRNAALIAHYLLFLEQCARDKTLSRYLHFSSEEIDGVLVDALFLFFAYHSRIGELTAQDHASLRALVDVTSSPTMYMQNLFSQYYAQKSPTDKIFKSLCAQFFRSTRENALLRIYKAAIDAYISEGRFTMLSSTMQTNQLSRLIIILETLGLIKKKATPPLQNPIRKDAINTHLYV